MISLECFRLLVSMDLVMEAIFTTLGYFISKYRYLTQIVWAK